MSAETDVIQGITRHTRIRGENGRYSIIQQVGLGGNGTVFLAYGNVGPLTGNLCAIKVFHGTDGMRRRRFLLEREFGQKFEHRSLVKVIDKGSHLDRPFSVLDYWPSTLTVALQDQTLSTVAKIAYVLQMLSGLSYLADQGYVHRDIKPDNVLVRGPNCALSDFGLLRKAQGGLQDADAGAPGADTEAKPSDHMIEASELEHTIVNSAIGEARMPRCYRTPELVRAMTEPGYEPPCSSDVYQLGLVLSEMFFGMNPQAPPPKGGDGRYDLKAPLVMQQLPMMKQGIHARIRENIASMLDNDSDIRPSCATLLDEWVGVFSEACDRSMDLDQRLIVHW